jgi:hypothetical protein
MTTEYRGTSASSLAAQRAKFRLGFRDVWSWNDALAEGLTATLYDSDLSTKARKLFDVLASTAVAWPISQPLVGANGSVFVIDIQVKPSAPAVSVGEVMRIITALVPGCDLIAVALISPAETSAQAVSARESFFQKAAATDSNLDATTGIGGAVNTATNVAKQAWTATRVALLVLAVGAVWYVRRSAK